MLPGGAYPSPFWNREEPALTTPTSSLPYRKRRPTLYGRDDGTCFREGHLHQPLIPNQSEAWQLGQDKGAVRSVYTADDPMNFQVMYHDPRKRIEDMKNDPFTLANYHPASRHRKRAEEGREHRIGSMVTEIGLVAWQEDRGRGWYLIHCVVCLGGRATGTADVACASAACLVSPLRTLSLDCCIWSAVPRSNCITYAFSVQCIMLAITGSAAIIFVQESKSR